MELLQPTSFASAVASSKEQLKAISNIVSKYCGQAQADGFLKACDALDFTTANTILDDTVKELTGHGIGSNLHEQPDVPNYGKAGTGPVLKEGMCIAVEPMLNLGTSKIYILDDDWTIITRDGLPSAHYEHSVVVTKDGYEIMTGDDNFE